MYQAYGLLQPGNDFNWNAAIERLRARLPHLTGRRDGDHLILSSADWEIHLVLNAGAAVLQESAAMAEKIAGDIDGADIARCDRRIEVASDVSDPFMEHFNDFLGVVEVLHSFKGLIAVDPREPSLM
jgi:hypothetical protein